ncbi:MAG: hypothetical protein ACYSXF_06775 [Planctomycetota bacterium]|jgi:hypothetical protein
MNTRSSRREAGTALFVSVLLMVLIGALGLAALDTIAVDRQVSGVQNRSLAAFWAAEAAVAQARDLVVRRGEEGTTFTYPADFPSVGAPTNLGDAALSSYFRLGLPLYYADPDPALVNPIKFLRQGSGRIAAQGGNLVEGKQKPVEGFWQINVMGQTADGTTRRLEAVEWKLSGQRGYGGG